MRGIRQRRDPAFVLGHHLVCRGQDVPVIGFKDIRRSRFGGEDVRSFVQEKVLEVVNNTDGTEQIPR